MRDRFASETGHQEAGEWRLGRCRCGKDETGGATEGSRQEEEKIPGLYSQVVQADAESAHKDRRLAVHRWLLGSELYENRQHRSRVYLLS